MVETVRRGDEKQIFTSAVLHDCALVIDLVENNVADVVFNGIGEASHQIKTDIIYIGCTVTAQ